MGALFPDKNRWAFWIVVLAALATAAVFVFCWMRRDAVAVDGILRIGPHNIALAVLLMLVLPHVLTMKQMLQNL